MAEWRLLKEGIHHKGHKEHKDKGRKSSGSSCASWSRQLSNSPAVTDEKHWAEWRQPNPGAALITYAMVEHCRHARAIHQPHRAALECDLAPAGQHRAASA